ncbi:hypothetical protein F4801DRAFT_71160 [Xylaria longipes]|nr:hypothetical protein F4801DRAFT_71160 [Xylaria longipes]RYC64472.1 hypothetical protein CHU98_g1764 [Xylaria longipes]
MASLNEDESGLKTETSTNPPDPVSQSTHGPPVDIQVSFDRPTHSYSQPEPPRVIIRAISRAQYPITLYTWRRPLDPKGALTSNGYVITDLATDNPVKTTYLMINRGPQLRVRGGPDDQFFLTLQPNTPVELSTGFGRGGGGIKPDPRTVVERGWERDEHGNERKIRRSTQATGVDGLEPGHTYSVGLNMEALGGCWWAPVTRDEILVDHRGEGSYIQDYPWNTETPLKFRVSEATMEVLD